MTVKSRQFFLVVPVVLILLVGCAGEQAKPTPTLVPTPAVLEKPTYFVQRGTVTRVVQFTGRVTPVQQQELFFHVDGVVNEVLVKTGDPVQAGAVLARLDQPERYQADLTAAELACAQEQQQLDQVRLDAPVKLAKAKQDLAQAAKDLEKSKSGLKQLDYPVHVGDVLLLEKYRTDFAISKKNYQDAQGNYDSLSGRPETDPQRADALNALIEARTAYNMASFYLNWAEGKVTQADIDRAQTNLDLAQATFDKAAAEVRRWEPDSPTGDIYIAELSLANGQARLGLARQALANIELTAPFTGQVLAMGIAPGSSVKAYQAVLNLADPTQLEVSALATAEDLNALGVGQTASVRLSEQQEKEVAAKIRSLPMALSSSSQANTSPDNTVHFTLIDAGSALTLGETASIQVTVDSHAATLWLPPAALRSFQEQDFVLVEDGGVQRRVNVTLGMHSADQVEILSGLKEGQRVVGP